MTNRLIGYARVSTGDQAVDPQIDALNAAGCVQIYADAGVSGATTSRPELDRCLAALRPGDSLVVSRLDRLGPAKAVAQIGAAIGREFSYALLAAVTHKAEVELLSALDRLMAAGLLFRQGEPPHATYWFKHALVRDAAYGTLLREPRRALHARVAETLDGQFPEVAENQPELLARHSSEAGLIEKAAGLWGKAGQRSLARSALIEAIEQLRRALDLIAASPATKATRRSHVPPPASPPPPGTR